MVAPMIQRIVLLLTLLLLSTALLTSAKSSPDTEKTAVQVNQWGKQAVLELFEGSNQNAAENEALAPRSLDLLSPFRSFNSHTPFMTTRDEPSAVLADNSTAPKEKDFIGKCFSSEKDLNKATLNCSSHGTPIQSSKGGKSCYRCNCKQTKVGGKRFAWAGAACQKQDISKPFVLLLTTTIGLMSVIFGSVYFLFYEGQKELPSVLAGISIPNK